MSQFSFLSKKVLRSENLVLLKLEQWNSKWHVDELRWRWFEGKRSLRRARCTSKTNTLTPDYIHYLNSAAWKKVHKKCLCLHLVNVLSIFSFSFYILHVTLCLQQLISVIHLSVLYWKVFSATSVRMHTDNSAGLRTTCEQKSTLSFIGPPPRSVTGSCGGAAITLYCFMVLK